MSTMKSSLDTLSTAETKGWFILQFAIMLFEFAVNFGVLGSSLGTFSLVFMYYFILL